MIESIGSSLYDSMNTAQSVSGGINATTSENTTAKSTQDSTAASTSAASSPDYYYDVKDLNKDGIVTLAEEIQYALTHPGEVLTSQAAASTGTIQSTAGYNQQGAMNEETAKSQGQIDIIV